MEQITLSAPDISCQHCKHTIEQELGTLSGVQNVLVEVGAKCVNVSFDSAKTSESAIIAKLDEAGYPAAV